MNILLLGGSNTGMQGGWAAHFVPMAQARFQCHIENGFLGAVGSLYGLLYLLKNANENKSWPDIIIFEYCLNDIILANTRIISPLLIEDTLNDVIALCAFRGIKLQFVCLEPRYTRQPGAIGPTARVNRAYAQAARRSGLPPCLLLKECLGRSPQAEDYIDDNHLNPPISEQVARALLDRVAQTIGQSASSMRPKQPRRPAFSYVAADRARFAGNARVIALETRVFSGPFIEMRRPASSLWPGRGKLAALLIFSQTDSGWYGVQGEKRAVRKNAFSSVLAILPKFISLSYIGQRLVSTNGMRVTMPDDAPALMRLPPDRTETDRPPAMAFSEQILSVHSALFWQGPYGIKRWIEPIDALARKIWRQRRNKAALLSAGDDSCS